MNMRAANVSAKDQTHEQMMREVSMQTNALLQLVRWRNNLIIFITLCLVLSYCGFTGNLVPFAIGVVCLSVAIFCIGVVLVMHCSIRHGRKNVERIKKLVEKK